MMHQQHPNKGPTPGHQVAYQPFSNEEISPNSADWQNSPGVIQQGIPVSGGPVMSYPAHMGHFEVANSPVTVTAQNDPAYAKLDTWPYLVYKYWILAGISMNLMMTVMIGMRLGFSQEFAWDLVGFCIHIYNVAQLVFVFEAISKRSEAKIDRALKFMKIYAFLLWIYVFVHSGRMMSGNGFGRWLEGDQSDHSDDNDNNDDNKRDHDGREDHHRNREHHGEHNRDHDNNNWDNNNDNQEGWNAGGIFACETEICRVKFLIGSVLSACVAVGMFYILFWYGARKVKQILASPRLSQNQRNPQVQRA
jgi:hypothetical protein